MHIYVFGSMVRGEVSPGSDVDMLALVDGFDPRFDLDVFSIYSYRRLKELWGQGNPFAWHLALESKLVFTSDGSDFITSLKEPAAYRDCVADCEKFRDLFRDAWTSMRADNYSTVFDLSTVFLGIRNLATCYSLGASDCPSFSRHSALCLGDDSLVIQKGTYDVLERARILCTRGNGPIIQTVEVGRVLEELGNVDEWMTDLVRKARAHERV
jgi:hypothetical protein